jgi:hypothetical protein
MLYQEEEWKGRGVIFPPLPRPGYETMTPGGAMPDDVEKFLNDAQQLDSRRQELIKDLLRQKEASIKAFDEKLARLGYPDGAGKRSHHKRAADAKAASKQTA